MIHYLVMVVSFLIMARSGVSLCRTRLQVTAHMSLMSGIRTQDFPILSIIPHKGKKLIYLDSGASSFKPLPVLNSMDNYYKSSHSNVHRGTHYLAQRATEAYENARGNLASFINAPSADNIVFTRGATDSINLVAQSWGAKLRPGDEIILTTMEHHSNLVPWQLLAKRTGSILKFAKLTPDETLDIDHFRRLLSEKTRLVSIAHVSNVLGVVNPVQKVIQMAHDAGAVVLLDSCQALPSLEIDVQALGADFLVASGHKMYGPTGIGFLYGKSSLLKEMPPVQGGGEMIEEVTLEYSTYADPPLRFEAGTPPIAEAVGLGAACDYLREIGMNSINAHTSALGAYLYESLKSMPEIRVLGPHPRDHHRVGLVSFVHQRHHGADLSFFLDQEGVAVRCGHHCTSPLHHELGVSCSVRASLGLYNSRGDIDEFIAALNRVITMLNAL